MDIRDIQIVMAVAAAKSYNKAADMLGVTHQSVSKAMGRINRQVRKPLFRREGARLVATDFGLEFLRDAAGLEQAFAEFERKYAALPHRAAGDGELSVALVTGGNAGCVSSSLSFTKNHRSFQSSSLKFFTDHHGALGRPGRPSLGAVGHRVQGASLTRRPRRRA